MGRLHRRIQKLPPQEDGRSRRCLILSPRVKDYRYIVHYYSHLLVGVMLCYDCF